jgi:WD40 repeat protein
MYFATGSLDGSTIIWDSKGGSALLTLVGHEYGVRDVAFGFDGSLIATGGFDGTAKVGMQGQERSSMKSRDIRVWYWAWRSARMEHILQLQARTRLRKFGIQKQGN